MRNKFKKILTISLFILLSLILLAGCQNNEESSELKDPEAPEFESLSELNGKIMGGITGSIDVMIRDTLYPDSKLQSYNSFSDSLIALQTKKVDYIITNGLQVHNVISLTSNITYIEEPAHPQELGAVFKKNDSKSRALMAEFNEFVAEMNENGKSQELYDDWAVNSNRQFNIKFDANAIPLTIGITANMEPYQFTRNGSFAGFEIEYIELFCKEYGYKPNYAVYDYSGVLAAAQMGKTDIVISSLCITDERAEIVDFSDPYINDPVIVLVRKNKANLTNSSNLVPEYESINALNNKKFGIVSNTTYDKLHNQLFPNNSTQYFKNFDDIAQAIEKNEIDYCFLNKLITDFYVNKSSILTYIDESLLSEDIGIAVRKTENKDNLILIQLNEFIKNLVDSGQNKILYQNWSMDPNHDFSRDFASNAKPLKVGLTATTPPYQFILNDQFTGLEIELITLFCQKYGYYPEYQLLEYDNIFDKLNNGSIDCAIAALSITPERLLIADFTNPYITDPINTLVRGTNAKLNLFENIKESFNRTFIKEDRYKLILNGVLTTLIITVASAIIGTLFGILLYIITRRNIKIFNKLLAILARISAGLPVVVVLMILCYLVFANSSISSVTISIIGFSLVTALSVYPMLQTSINGIDKSQIESGYALGFTDKQTFFKILLPQAMTGFIPGYKNALMTLVNSTAIVGYIAVQDITKVSELIRARTYEAFFPLITTALIYLGLGLLLALIIRLFAKKYEPEKRTDKEVLKQFGK